MNPGDQLAQAVERVINDSVQETDGPYSWKNNQCKHGNYGYQGCEACVCEYLETVLDQYRKATA